MFPIFIALSIITIVGLVYVLLINKRKSKALRNFNYELEYKNIPRYMANLCSHELIEVKIEMQELPIDAITQCMHIDNRSNAPSRLALSTLRTITQKPHEVKMKYNVAQLVSYLVLSGKELHYLFYEEGDIKEHFTLDEARMQSARLGQVSGLDRFINTYSIRHKKLNKLHIDIGSQSMEILFYETITDAPEGSLQDKNTSILQAKNALIGEYFKEQLKAKYPSLFNLN